MPKWSECPTVERQTPASRAFSIVRSIARFRNLEQILVLRQNFRDSRQRLDALYNQTGAAPRESQPAPAATPAPAASSDKSSIINELDEILSMLGDDDDEDS